MEKDFLCENLDCVKWEQKQAQFGAHINGFKTQQVMLFYSFLDAFILGFGFLAASQFFASTSTLHANNDSNEMWNN